MLSKPLKPSLQSQPPQQPLAQKSPPPRSEAQLRRRQSRGELRVCTAAVFRERVAQAGLEAAYADTDVVVAADAGFTDQASLLLTLGPTDPPMRLRDALLAGVRALAGSGSGELMLPIGGGLGEPARFSGAQVLAALLDGEAVAVDAIGEATALQPRRELHTSLTAAQLGTARLLLHRAIVENGIVAVSRSEGITASAQGPLLGPLQTALFSCGGAGSIGLTMPGLAQLGPGSPVLVAGGLGWVLGAGSGHQPGVARAASGHALAPGAAAAVAVELEELQRRWIRPCFFEGHGCALLVALAAPVPLLNLEIAGRAAAGNEALQVPVLDVGIPRRVKPSLGSARYDQLLAGRLPLPSGDRVQELRAAPAFSPRLAAEHGDELVRRLQDGRFPLRLPALPLPAHSTLVPVEA